MKETTGTTKRRWEDNIRVDLKEIGWEGGVWMHLDQNWEQWRVLVNTEINFRAT
jgi:hypothetical protein